MGKRLRLQFAAPHSKKNRGVILRGKGGRPFWKPSDEVQREAKAIAAAARDALHAMGVDGAPWIPSADVEIEVVYHARSGEVSVEIAEAEPRPKGFTGRKRDLHGLIEAIADALEGVTYANDNQVSRVVLVRRLD